MAFKLSVNFDMDMMLTEFDPEDCPLDCSRPCQKVCPANAISLKDRETTSQLSHGTNAHVGFKVFCTLLLLLLLFFQLYKELILDSLLRFMIKYAGWSSN